MVPELSKSVQGDEQHLRFWMLARIPTVIEAAEISNSTTV